MIAFEHTAYLWGMLSLAVPLALHMMNRRRPASLSFPSIRFLQRAQLPQDGRRRLRDILLLALRMLSLAAAVLLMARPRWVPEPAQDGAPVERKAMFVLDCSASMGGWGHWERAMELAAEALGGLGGWKVGVVASASGVVSELAPTSDFGAVEAFLRGQSVTNLAGNHRAAMQKANAFVAGARDGRIYLASDFRRNDWGGAGKTAGPGVELRFLDCGQDGEDNCGVTAVRTMLLPRGRRRVVVSVRNYANEKAERVLTVEVGGEAQKRKLSIPGMGQQSMALAFADAPGEASGTALLDSDSYAKDDSRSFSLTVAGMPLALVVAAADESERIAMAASFTGSALSSGGEGSADGFEVSFVNPSDIGFADISGVRVVFALGGMDGWANDAVKRIAQMVEDGGCLIVTPGANGAALTLKKLREAALMTAQSAGIAEASPKTSLGVGWILPESPLGRLFGDWADSDLYLFPIFRHLRLRPEEPAAVLMKSLDDLPLLLEKACGAGKCYFFAYDFGPECGAMALTSAFLPMLRELCKASVPEEYGVKRLECGARLELADGSLADTGRPGVLQADGWPVEICMPLQESGTDRVNVEDLRIYCSEGSRKSVHNAAPVDAVELWRYIAVALAVLLLLESIARANTKE